MSNDYYNKTGAPASRASLSSAAIRAEFAAIEAAFGMLPAVTGNANEVLVVNSGGTALTSVPITGSVADTGSAQTFSNKTFVAPALGTPASGNLSSCTGNLSSCTADGTNQIGFRNIPQNSKSTSYTAVLDDAGRHLLHPSADTTARTFTIPANSSVAYPIGTALTFVNQNGAGDITIAITTDTMRFSPSGATGSRTLAANGIATAIKITSTEWIISGVGLT